MTTPRRHLFAFLLVCSSLAAASAACALECPAPPVQIGKEWDALVRTEVGKIGPVRGAELQVRVRSTTQDLLGRLPEADKVYLEQMMFAAYCSALHADASLAEADKAKQILDYRRELQSSLKR